MAPRPYRNDKRQLAVEETRRRIVQATMELHNANGILATRFEDVAKRADVATATVYRHFPTLEDLVDACGALTIDVTRPPVPENASNLFAGLRSLPERIDRMVSELNAYYQRSRLAWVAVLRDCDKIERLAQFVTAHQSTLSLYVDEMLRGVIVRDPAPDTRVICALLDYPMWKSLIDRGLRPEEVGDELGRLVREYLESRSHARNRHVHP